MRLRFLGTLLTAANVLCHPDAAAQGDAVRLTTLDAATRRQVVDTMSARLRRHYVDADTGTLIANHLQKRLASGAYDSIASPARFAEILTNDLHAINNDKHLRVAYAPDNPGLRPGPEGIRMFGPPPPSPGGRAPHGPPPSVIAAARQSHYGLGRVDILPGNIGYLDVRGFAGALEVEDMMVSALKYLETTDAIIFDLRRNGGGSPQSVNFLISHFVTRDTVASLTVKNRSGNETFTRYTLAEVPGPRRPSVPLFVLTSGVTASAGEDFTFVLQNMKRATIVGDRTAGAGHNNAFLDVGHGFSMSTSFTRVMDPRTGKEWERSGVIPDVEVPQARALDVAQAMALKLIAEREANIPRRHVLELMREAAEAQNTPRPVATSLLASYAGEYTDGRRVTVEGDRLQYSARPGAPSDPMIPLSESTFAIGATRYGFERGGAGGMRLTITPAEGEALTYERVSAGGKGH